MNTRARRDGGKKPDKLVKARVRYRIVPDDPKGHYFDVACEIDDPDRAGQHVALPAWIPGSYMIREFARNIVSIEATCGGRELALTKRDKHTWQAAPCGGTLHLRYRVYAWDASVRAAHLDQSHGFFNGTSVFLRVAGHEHEPHEVELLAPRGAPYRQWRVATALPAVDADPNGFGRYRADNYDALIDHPVEMGSFRLERFEAAGVPHEIAFTGHTPGLDAKRITADLALLCAAQIHFFSSSTGLEKAPFERYVFLTAVTGEGYGGLEHRASTALLCSRDALPVVGQAERTPAYRSFLGLASHEYFHGWNVKRIKPAAFAPYDLDRENYTTLLWIFEGFTSYYDDLFLVRTGLASRQQYLEMLAKTIDEVRSGEGRKRQSVGESSFDAWVKYYRQDENTPNAVVSYYKKGALIGLCLDLFLRRESRGKASLDDVMRLMWDRFGRDFYAPGGVGSARGVGEDEFPALVEEATGIEVRKQVASWAYGTLDLPLTEELAAFGLVLRFEPRQPGPSLDARTTGSGAECRITHVDEGGAAHGAGLAGGDILVAIDLLRVVPGRVDALLSRYRAGDAVEVVAFRGDLLQTRRLVLGSVPTRCVIADAPKPSRTAMRLRERWLTGLAQ